MNQIYSVIINRRIGSSQVVSEHATGRKKSSVSKTLTNAAKVAVAGLALMTGMAAHAEIMNGGHDFNTDVTVNDAMLVGVGADGVVNISANVVYDKHTVIGVDGGWTGIMTVTGSDAKFTSDDIQVGQLGAGYMVVQQGGSVATGNMEIGSATGGGGTVTVTGEGAQLLIADELIVGGQGYGYLNIIKGARVDAVNMMIGGNIHGWTNGMGSGSVNVSGQGAALNVSGQLAVGMDGFGDLSVNSGGVVNTASLVIGTRENSTGGVLVSGQDSAINVSGIVMVGAAAQGWLKIEDGAELTAAQFLSGADSHIYLDGVAGSRGVLAIGQFIGNTGEFTFDGGILRATNNFSTAQNMLIANGGAFIDTNGFDIEATAGFTQSDVDTTGGLNKHGAGTLTLSGTSLYAGDTVVDGGTLSVNGVLKNSATFVNSGAALAGSGTIQSATIHSGATLVGNGLTVNGDLHFNGGSVFEVTAGAASDKAVNVTGSSDLTGATVNVRAQDIHYDGTSSQTILNSAGGLNGTFDGVTSDLAFLTASLAHSGNDVVLHLDRNTTSFVDVANNPNQQTVANVLDQMSGMATGDMNDVLTAFTGQSTDQARTSLTSMGGASLARIRTANIGFANHFSDQMQGRLQVLGAYDQDVKFAANETGAERMTLVGGLPMSSSQQPGFWVRGSGHYQTLNDPYGATKTTLRSGGMSVGVDTRVNRQLVLGAALSYDETDLRAGINDEGTSKQAALGMYASYATGPWGVNGNVMLGRSTNSMERDIQVGSINRTAESSFNGYTVSGYGEVTYDIYFDQWTLQPVAGLSVLYARTDAFAEQGADALNLDVSGQSRTTGRTMLGARAMVELGGVMLQPRAIWAHDMGKMNQSLTMQMQGAPMAFTITGTEQKKDALITGLTLSGALSKNTMLFADIQGEFKPGAQSYGATVGVRMSW